MQALTAAVRHIETEVIAPRALSVVDLTSRIQDIVAGSGIHTGLASVFCRHTTCGVLVNELEDGLEEDLGARLTDLVPNGYFAHDDLTRRTQNLEGPDERPNGAAHVRQMLFGATSQSIPVQEGTLALGRWQRLLFLELDEPRPRRLTVTLIG